MRNTKNMSKTETTNKGHNMSKNNRGINGTRPNNPSEGAWNCDLCGATNVHGAKGAICGCGESRKRNGREQPQAQRARAAARG